MKIKNWTCCLFIAFVVVTLCSFSTSWLFSKPLMYDSAVFQVIGKNWVDGKIPYKDLWELKGPIIFLFNALGYYMFSSKFGVYVIQIFCMTYTLYFILKMFLLEFTRKTSIFLTCLTVFYLAVLYEAGNCVEEYLMPLLTYAFYLLYRYVNKCVDSKEYDFPYYNAFLFGCVLGFSLMSRLTNAISICAAVIVIGVNLIIYKKIRNLIWSFFYFICGFLLLTIPFFLYFYQKDALAEMWYGTFLFGLEYAGSSGFDLFSFFGLRHVSLRLANCYLLIIVSVLVIRCNPQRIFSAIMWLTVSLLTIAVFLQLRPFGHYYIITIPFVPVIFIELNKLMKVNKIVGKFNFVKCVVYVYVLLGTLGIVNNVKNYYTVFSDYNELDVFERIVNRLPHDFRTSFIAYDCDTEFYLYFDIPPQYKFFYCQSLMIYEGASIKKRIEDCFYCGNAKYLVVYGYPELLKETIKSKYTFMFSQKSKKGGIYNVYLQK